MKVAVLSGKGGTGKTTVSTSLAKVTPDSQYADCDVEEPNGNIFMKQTRFESKPVLVLVPDVDDDLCTGCGACGDICQFNAIAVVKGRVLIFPELCHHCGACRLVCQLGAISELERSIGTVDVSADRSVVQGCLNIGEPSGLPIIGAIQTYLEPNRVCFLDCPPGAGCSVVKTLEGCQFAVLVTEPTPFGLHDLKIAVQLVKQMNIPAGVVINKAGGDQKELAEFCDEQRLPVLMEIPFSRELASAYAEGILPVDHDDSWHQAFKTLSDQIIARINAHAADRSTQQ